MRFMGLPKEASTIIFSTHRMEQVEEICDHIVLVNLGQESIGRNCSADIKQQFKENKFGIKLSEVPASINANASFEIAEQKANELTVKIKEGYQEQ